MHFPRLNQWLAAFGMLMIFTGFSGAVSDLLYPDQSMDYQFDVLEQSSSEGFVPYYLPADSQVQGTTAPDLPYPTGTPGTAEPHPTLEVPASSTPAPSRGVEGSTPVNHQAPSEIMVPDRMVIPGINLDAPVEPAKMTMVKIGNSYFEQWDAPNHLAAGWNTNSATLGVTGNSVFIGHHNINGKVFAHLSDLKADDYIMLYSGKEVFVYTVSNVMILPEKYQELEVRLRNALWLEPTKDERITLVSCWPPDNNTDRVIVVARPLQ